jgi:ribosomal protein L11 methyltransferase
VIRLAVRVRSDPASEALARLLVLSPAGLEEIDVDAQTVEYVLYGAAGELPSVAELQVSLGDALIAVHRSEIADDWSERWRRFHQPIVVASRLHVRPPWHPPPAAAAAGPGLIDVVIEPGQAFGTGAHATTRLCLELLVGLTEAEEGEGAVRGADATAPSPARAPAPAGAVRGALLDVGCGSGVLAIAAAKLGWSPVIAIDHEPESVAATRANAQRNNVEIDVRAADLHSDPLPPADTLVANLLGPLLLALSERLQHVPAQLIASGLLPPQADALAHALATQHGLREQERRGDGDWVAVRFAPADPRVSS